MNTTYPDKEGKKLIAVKVNGKWRKATRIVGRLFIEYEVDMENMQLMASYGNFLYRSLTKYVGVKVEDVAWVKSYK